MKLSKKAKIVLIIVTIICVIIDSQQEPYADGWPSAPEPEHYDFR